VSPFVALGFGPSGWGAALLEGALMTLLVATAGLLIGAAIGALVSTAKLSEAMLPAALGDAYAAIFRGVPELLVVYFVYFGSSALLTSLAHVAGYEGFLGVPAFLAGALAVGVISGAYQAELYRGAFLAIPRGELEAARACGMGGWLMFRRIVAPQVVRFALPGLNNLWQVALKDSSLISVTGLAELMRVSQVASGSTRQPFTFYLAGGALYLVLTVFSNRVFEFAEVRAARSRRRPGN
jgi:octopine/nopaline transport system permease protein